MKKTKRNIAIIVVLLFVCAAIYFNWSYNTQWGKADAEMAAAQLGESSDPKTRAALLFALKVVGQRGQVSGADVQALRDAGFSDEQVVEILAHVALNLFTNYVNLAFAVPVDFPAVKLSSG